MYVCSGLHAHSNRACRKPADGDYIASRSTSPWGITLPWIFWAEPRPPDTSDLTALPGLQNVEPPTAWTRAEYVAPSIVLGMARLSMQAGIAAANCVLMAQTEKVLLQKGLVPSQTKVPLAQRELLPSEKELPPSQKELPLSRRALPPLQRGLPPAQKELPLLQKELLPSQRESPLLQKELPLSQGELPPSQKGLPLSQKEVPL